MLQNHLKLNFGWFICFYTYMGNSVNVTFNFFKHIVDATPSCNFNQNGQKFVEWCGHTIRSHKQKLIIGTAALATQPLIDLYNKKVDEDTRKISCARTTARLIVGTTTGVFIRSKFINLVEKNSEMGNVADKTIKNFFTPSSVKIDDVVAYRNYKTALGTLLAIGVMMITNFAVDAPLTQLLANVFVKKMSRTKSKEVLNAKN